MTSKTKQGLPRRRVGWHAPIEERILLHTDRSGDCWLWTAYVDPRSGYARMYLERKLKYGHRVSYETFVGDIPAGMHVDHLCRVRRCVNPFHLEVVTAQENVLRGESPGAKARRRDLCMYGHPYAEHGTVVTGRRICRVCKAAYQRLYRALPYAEAGRRKMAGEPVVDLAVHFAAERRAAA